MLSEKRLKVWDKIFGVKCGIMSRHKHLQVCKGNEKEY